MDKNEFAQAELVALRKGLEEASKIIEALEAENAALRAEIAARGLALSEREAFSLDVVARMAEIGCTETPGLNQNDPNVVAVKRHIQTARNLLERAKR
jgi:hypothetical protein